MKYILTCIVFLLVVIEVNGQNMQSGSRPKDAMARLENKELEGIVMLQMDSLILENYNKHLVQNSKYRGVSGYRIRIFSDNGMGAKENQKRVRAEFLSSFPGIPTYYPYEGSYYKIYVGDFRTKRDALKILDSIRRKFPDAFIVEDKIVIEE